MEPRRVATVKQIEFLMEYLRENPGLRFGRGRSKEVRHVNGKLWNVCAEKLNQMGPTRDAKEWAKYWSDLKSRVKIKTVQIQKLTDAGTAEEYLPHLTYVEKRILEIIGRERHSKRRHSSRNEGADDNNMEMETFDINCIKQEKEDEITQDAEEPMNIEVFINKVPVLEEESSSSATDELLIDIDPKVQTNQTQPQPTVSQQPPINEPPSTITSNPAKRNLPPIVPLLAKRSLPVSGSRFLQPTGLLPTKGPVPTMRSLSADGSLPLNGSQNIDGTLPEKRFPQPEGYLPEKTLSQPDGPLEKGSPAANDFPDSGPSGFCVPVFGPTTAPNPHLSPPAMRPPLPNRPQSVPPLPPTEDCIPPPRSRGAPRRRRSRALPCTVCPAWEEMGQIILKLEQSHAKTALIQTEAALKQTEVLKLQAEGITNLGGALRDMVTNLSQLIEQRCAEPQM